MLRNYLIAAYRNLVKNKAQSFINIAGLSVGMAVAMLIGFWIKDELSFNKGFDNYNRIALVWQNVNDNGSVNTWNDVPFPLGAELRKEYGSDFTHVIMATGSFGHILGTGDKKLNLNGPYMEPAVTDMLSMDMLRGDRNGLESPDNILLSASTAKTLFGNDDPMGKVVRVDNQVDLKVSGIYRDFPANSDFSTDRYMMSWDLLARLAQFDKRDNPWRSNSYSCFVQLAPNADFKTVSEKIKDVKMRFVHQDELSHKPQLFLLPMSRWHLYGDFKGGFNVGGAIRNVWMFGLIGCFVLFLACINFMNLSTARSEGRAREVGIRKAIGSLRGQLITQFMGESLLISALALVLALALAFPALPYFNKIAGKSLEIPWTSPGFWATAIAFCAFTGLLAGSYPALYLSSFRPVKVLKGLFRAGPAAAIPRKVLVVLQFVVSVVLIVGTIVVFRQIQYAKDRPLGYNSNGLVMTLMYTDDIHKHFSAVRDELIKSGAISEMAETDSPPTDVWSTNSGFEWPGKDPGLALDFPNADLSPEFGKTVGWEFTQGRDFSMDYPTDSLAFVVNETAVKFMGLQHPVGTTVKWDNVPYHIIGVIKDVLTESAYTPVRPSFYHLTRDKCDIVIFRIDPHTSVHSALATVEKVFKRYDTAQPFDFTFTDKAFENKFADEERVGTLAGFFSILAIFISCLGLFGMASFTAERRTREIGIRKVLGASVVQLWSLLSREFVVLVLISLLVSLPLSYLLTRSWLSHYEYRAHLGWWIFAASGLGALAITLLTVSFQSIRAALANPSRSLRTE
jgi:ABC-type antimicrobial peptide transport system permease subunit